MIVFRLDLLHDAVAACQPPGTSEAEVLRGCAATWGTVYGIARLAASIKAGGLCQVSSTC